MSMIKVYVVKVKTGLCFRQPEAQHLKCFVEDKIGDFRQ